MPASRTPRSSHSVTHNSSSSLGVDSNSSGGGEHDDGVYSSSSVRLLVPVLSKFVMDLKGPFPTQSRRGFRYCLIVTCYTSRYRWVYFLKSKDDTFGHLQQFYKAILVLRAKLSLCSETFTIFKSDGGGEFNNEEAKQYFGGKIDFQFTSPHTPHQNGIAERTNRTIAEDAFAMMTAAKSPLNLWDLAVRAAVYVSNFLPSNSLNNSSPY